MNFRFILNFCIFFSIFPLFAIDIPSDEIYEPIERLEVPKDSNNQTHKVYYDFFEPPDLHVRNVMRSYLEKVDSISLYKDPHWIKLLRYHKSIFGNYKSEITSASYFLSEVGRNKPRSELMATIRALFSTQSDLDSLPKCKFPERYHWLREKLEMGKEFFEFEKCPRFQKWRSTLNVIQVRLVFAAHYLQAPASMFGHTFLKLRQDLNQNSELLDYGVGYAADPGNIDWIRYVIGGVTGGYKGKFSIYPYYMKVNEYNDLENRDLWEYDINLNDSERESLLRQLWEMGDAEFDYYFQKENCAYQIEKILDIAKSNQNTFNYYRFTYAPIDLLKFVVSDKESIKKNPIYRPSLWNQFRFQIQEMNEEEKELFFNIISNINDTNVSSDLFQIKKDEVEKKVENEKVISALLDFYRYKYPDSEILNSNENYFQLLRLQTKIETPQKTSELNKINYFDSPHNAHSSSRVLIGYGNSSYGNFMETGIRVAYHDILNKSNGLLSNSEIQFLNVQIRNYENKKPEITSINLVRLLSLTPYNSLSKKFSYLIDIGSQTVTFKETEVRKQVGNIDLMAGYSFAREFSNGFNFGNISFLVGAKSQTNSDFRYGMRYGPQGGINYTIEIGDFKVLWFASYAYLNPSKNENYFQNSLKLRYAIAPDHELRLEFTSHPHYNETLFAYHLLF